MFQLKRYIKPYLHLSICAILFLFSQAILDLSLPDNLSRIINIGIQQKGIENAVPIAIRKTQLDHCKIFLDEENQTRINQIYSLISKNSTEYDKYLEEFPILENESIYLLDKNFKDDINEVELNLAKSLLVVSIVDAFILDPTILSDYDIDIEINISSISDDLDVWEFLSTLPEILISFYSIPVNKYFNELGSELIIQLAILEIAKEYEIVGIDLNRLQMSYVIQTGIRMVAIALLSIVSAIFVGFISGRVATGISKDIRQDIFEKIINLSSLELETFSINSLIARTTNDVVQIENMSIQIIRVFFYAPIIAIGGSIKAFQHNSSISLIILIGIAVLSVILAIVYYFSRPVFQKMQNLLDKTIIQIRNYLSGIFVIRSFNREKYEEKRFDETNYQLKNTNLITGRILVVLIPTMILIMNLLTIILIWIGSDYVSDLRISIGDLLAIIQYSIQIVIAFLTITSFLVILPRANISSSRIAQVLSIESNLESKEQKLNINQEDQMELRFQNVNFIYPHADDYVLENISFNASMGEIIAIVGPTGSGKSTLFNLILKIFSVNSGGIFLNDINIDNLNRRFLRDLIGIVPQKDYFFADSIEKNITFGKKRSIKQKIITSIEISKSQSFIDIESNGLSSKISQNARNLSGGQKKRLSIARAFYKDPKIILLDDCYSALDYSTEAQIRKEIEAIKHQKITLLISQRISSILSANKIIFLKDGKIIAQGTHQDLIETCKDYKEMVSSQMGDVSN